MSAACPTGAALVDIVITERLDFARDFGDDHMEALTRALADDRVRRLQRKHRSSACTRAAMRLPYLLPFPTSLHRVHSSVPNLGLLMFPASHINLTCIVATVCN